jgi:gliding motility-associated-like protein
MNNMKILARQIFTALALLLLSAQPLWCQIWAEDFNSYPDGTTNFPPKWTSNATDCDDGGNINLGPGASQWGVWGGQFTINDIEGAPCCSPLGGGNDNSWLSETIDLTGFCDISISLDVSATGVLECESPGVPIYGCTGNTPPDNNHDQIVAEYNLDGAGFVQFGYVCGNNGVGTFSAGGLNGSTLVIRVSAANKANTEYYYFDNVVVNASTTTTPTFAPIGPFCETDPPFVLPTASAEGVTGSWDVGPTFNPAGMGGTTATITFTPGPGQCATATTMDITVNAAATPVLTPIGPYCTTDPPVVLQINPSGISGNWSGQGVTNNLFNPGAVNGSAVLTFTPDPGQCANTATLTVTVNTTGMPVLGTATLCETDPLFDLTTIQDPAWPTGVWTGTGVTGNTFNPAGLNGNISLSFIPTTPCALPAVTTITVNPPAIPALQADTICETGGLLDLTMLQDPAWSNGTWSGPGVSGNNFNPAGQSGSVTLTFAPGAGQCADTATAAVVVDTLVVPVISGLPASLCENETPATLPTTQSGINGNWSGPGVTNNAFNPSGQSSNVGLTFAPDAGQCADTATANIMVDTLAIPHIAADTLCETSGLYNLSNLADPNFPAGTWSGTGVSGNNFDPSGQNGNVTLAFAPSANCADNATTFILVNLPDTPMLGTAGICTSGGLFGLTPLADPAFPNGTWSGPGVTGDSLDPTGLNGSVMLTFTPSANCAEAATTTVQVNAPPVFSNLMEICDPATQEYTVSFGISGGDPVSYTIDGIPTGGNSFTSNPIASGNSYSFELDDANGCGPVTISGSADCNCTTFSGTMDFTGSPVLVCLDSAFSVLHNGDETLDPGDVLLFMLHDDPGAQLGTVIAVSNGTSFPFPVGVVAGQTWYVSAVAGNDDGMGGIDLTDPCLSVSQGVPVEFVSPQVVFSQGGMVCENDCYEFTVQFAGQAPFSMIYEVSVNGSATIDTLSTAVANTTLNICPANYGVSNDTLTLDVLSVTDGLCTATGGLLFPPQVVVIPAATESLSPTLCPGESMVVNGTIYNEFNPAGTEVFINGSANGCDSTVNVALSFFPAASFDLTQTLCPGESTTVNGTVYNAANPSGSEVLANASALGCDSTVNVALSFYPVATFDLTQTLCPGNTITVNGTVYDEANPAGTEVIPNASANSCDSTVNVNLTFNQQVTFNLDSTLCPNGSLTINGNVYDINTPAGMETFVNGSYLGCDSTVLVNLSFFTVAFLNLTQTLCPGGSLTVNGAVYDETNPAGLEILPNASANGCDSLVSVELSFFPPAYFNLVQTLCNNGSITVNGTVYDAANPTGTEVLANASVDGCDSTVLVNLNFIPEIIYNLDTTLCVGESIVVNGTVYDELNTLGTEVLVNGSYLGCDSTVNVNLTYFAPAVFDLSQQLCSGGSITVNGTVYNASNPAGTEVLPNASFYGCDSTVNISLTFSPPLIVPLDTLLCANESLLINGTFYNASNPAGVETFVNGSYLGCDSTVIISLSFLPASNGTLDTLLQPGQTIVVNGTVYGPANPSGTEVINGGSYTGCDSTVFVNLSFEGVFQPAVSVVPPLCVGGNDGSVVVENISGGVLPFVVAFDGANSVQTDTFPLVFNNVEAGPHQLTFLDAVGTTVMLEVFVPEPPALFLDLGDDQNVDLGESLTLSPVTNFAVNSWVWIPPDYLDCDACPEAVTTPQEDIIYTVTATDANGCLVTGVVSITVTKVRRIYVPNAFSPNGDGINDLVTVYAGGQVSNVKSFQIFNRWGGHVYVGYNLPPNDPSLGWDGRFKGKEMDPGVFAWFAEVEFLDGHVEIFEGDVTLVR